MENTSSQISFQDTQTAFAHYSDNSLKTAYRVYQLIGNNLLNNIGTTLTKIAVAINFPLKPFVKPLIFKQFCGGEDLKECVSTIELLKQRKVRCSLNYSVELKKNETDFDKTLKINKSIIAFAANKNYVSSISCKVSGFGHHHIMEKVQNQEDLTLEEQDHFERMKDRLHELCLYASENNTQVYLDAEESWVQDVIDDIVDELMEFYNQNEVFVFNTYQMYRHDRIQFILKSIDRAKAKNYKIGAKLVRGAYMEKERERAEKLNYLSPIYPDKESCDLGFNGALDLCINNIDTVSTCVATHNEYSCLLATKIMEENEIPKNHPHVRFSQLFGMGEHITFNLAEHGYNAAKYTPMGPVQDVIPYLIRRAEENTSIDGQLSREIMVVKSEIERRGLKL